MSNTIADITFPSFVSAELTSTKSKKSFDIEMIVTGKLRGATKYLQA